MQAAATSGPTCCQEEVRVLLGRHLQQCTVGQDKLHAAHLQWSAVAAAVQAAAARGNVCVKLFQKASALLLINVSSCLSLRQQATSCLGGEGAIAHGGAVGACGHSAADGLVQEPATQRGGGGGTG